MKVKLNEVLHYEGKHVAAGEVLDLPDETVKELGNQVTPVKGQASAAPVAPTTPVAPTATPAPSKTGSSNPATKE